MNVAPPLSFSISMADFWAAASAVVASSPVRLARRGSRTAVMTICATRYASSARLNCARLALKKSVISLSLTATFPVTSRSSTFCDRI